MNGLHIGVGFGGIEIQQSRWLTVAGERDSAAQPDWRERYMRNEGRWRAGVHRVHERAVRLENLWYTPQVADPNIYEITSDGRRTYIAHPDTVKRAVYKLREAMDKEVNASTYRALCYGKF